MLCAYGCPLPFICANVFFASGEYSIVWGFALWLNGLEAIWVVR